MKNSSLQQRPVPLRTCIATGQKLPKKELLRIVRIEDKLSPGNFHVKIDPSGKLSGRGANIIPSIEAFDIAMKRGALSRALKLERQLSKEETSDLREDFESIIWDREFRQGKKKVVIKVSKEDYKEKVLSRKG